MKGLSTQDKSVILQTNRFTDQQNGSINHSLSHLLAPSPKTSEPRVQGTFEPTSNSGKVHDTEPAPVSPYRTFSNRIRHSPGGTSRAEMAVTDILESDQAVINYYNSIRSRKGNDGYLSHLTRLGVRSMIKNFARFADLPINNTAFTSLVKYKREHPLSTDIEQVVQLFSQQQPLKSHAGQASWLLGLFKANFAPLSLRINNHFPPIQENCTEGIFLEIIAHQDQETKDMIQWGQYVPERAQAAYKVPFEDIDLTREDYAIVWIQALRSKSRTKHPCFVPIEFAKHVISQAKQANRKCPFPNYASLWKNLSAFARQEYKVRLISNYLRKRYNDIASSTNIPPSKAAFIMGDKTKIVQTGIHLDLIYGRGLRFVDELIYGSHTSGTGFHTSGLADALLIKSALPTQDPRQQSEGYIRSSCANPNDAYAWNKLSQDGERKAGQQPLIPLDKLRQQYKILQQLQSPQFPNTRTDERLKSSRHLTF